jgi:hypothetical protein
MKPEAIPMVNNAHKMLTVIHEPTGKSDPQPQPGWFHRCRRTGELEWVPAAAVPDRGAKPQQHTTAPR